MVVRAGLAPIWHRSLPSRCAYWRRSRPEHVKELEAAGRLYDALCDVQARAQQRRDRFLAGGWPPEAAWELTAWQQAGLPRMLEPATADPTFLRELARGPVRFSAGELRIILFVATAPWPPTAYQVAHDLGLDYRNAKHLVSKLVAAGVLRRTEEGLAVVADPSGWRAVVAPRKGWRMDLGRRLTRALTGTPLEREIELAALARPEYQARLRRLWGAAGAGRGPAGDKGR